MKQKTYRKLTAFLVAAVMLFSYVQPTHFVLKALDEESIQESNSAESGITDPSTTVTDPTTTEPKATEEDPPPVTEAPPTEPAPTEPAPTEPKPAEPIPTPTTTEGKPIVEPITIRFDTLGGSAVEPVSLLPGESLKSLPSSQLAEYTFKGWARKTGGDLISLAEVFTESATLYAVWEFIPLSKPGIPESGPAPNQVYIDYTSKGTPFATAGKTNVGILTTGSPVIGVDHPTTPGQVMLFKEAKEIPGLVNTWEVTLRIEAMDAETTSDVVLVVDRSGSMEGSPLTAAKNAAKNFVNTLIPTTNTGNVRIGLVSYAVDVTNDRALTQNKNNLVNSIDGWSANGFTFTQGGVRQGIAQMDANGTATNKHIVVLSDGVPNRSFQLPTDASRRAGYIAVGNNRWHTGAGYARSAWHDSNVRGTGSDIVNLEIETWNGRTAYYNHGNSARNEALYAKEKGYTVWTIGFNIGDSGDAVDVLRDMASTPGHYFRAASSDLNDIFNQIASQINSAVKNGVVSDTMAPGFEIPADQIANILASQNQGSVSYAGGVLSWTPGNLGTPISSGSKVKYAEIKYRVEINDAILDQTPDANDLYPTNQIATLKYTNMNNQQVTDEFPVPRVNPVLYKVRKIVQNSAGLDITNSVVRDFTVNVNGTGYNKNYILETDVRSGTKLLTSLRNAQTYNFSETAVSPGSLNDYVTTYFVNGVAVSPGQFTVVDGNTKDMELLVVNKEKPTSIQWTPTATKELSGRALKLGEFSFELKKGTTVLQTKTNLANGTIPFDPITFTFADVGTHTYTITEKTPVPAGVTHDPLVITYTVVVSVNAQGILVATPNVPADKIFNNVYRATGSFTPSVTKVLTGRSLVAGEFSFELKEGSTLLQTVSNTAAGAIPFTAINYTLADVGTHIYTITEKTPVPAGVTRDPMTVTYTVVVSDKGDGTLNVAFTPPADTIFNNTYGAAGQFTPSVTKQLTGRALKVGEFSFQLKKGDTVLQTVTNTAGGAIPFTAINYTLADIGTHVYTITELTPVPAGVTRDPMVVTYTVTVSDKGDGTLNVVFTPPADTTFNNTYAATGSFTPSVTKELSGRALKAGEFSFELKKGDTVLQTISSTAAGAIPFVAINYTLADVGTHTYTISEKTPVPAGVTRDPLIVTYTVTVSDKGDGTLTVSYPTPNDTVFNNSYAATGSFLPSVTKQLTGRALKAGEFSFELKKGDTLLQTVSNTAAGAIPFVAINYTLADVGTHIYTITEKTPVPAGVTRDPLVVTYTVTVSDKGDGTLNVVFTPPADTTFNNAYAAAGSFLPNVKKELTGRALKAGEFSFELKEGSTLLQTVSNTAAGAIPFTAINYTLADIGTHVYTISEKTPVPAGVTRDPLVVTYTVTVSDKGDGTLSVAFTPPADTIFNNTYAATGSFTPSVKKELTGRPLVAGEFNFELKEGATLLQTVSNTAAGAIPFAAINYTLADVGVHTYTISEKTPVPAGVTRDPLVVTYTVTVSDKGDGTLNVSYPTPNDTTFNNTYGAAGQFTPSVTKQLTGRALKAGEFSFQLKKGDTILQTVTNTAGGAIPFSAITYTLADVGTHVYTISELAPVPAGVTRDAMVVTYTVIVSDKGDGTLNVAFTPPADTEFNNVYRAFGTFLPSVTKELTGRALKAGEFSFELKEGTTLLQTVSNLANGTIPFTAIGYTLADVGVHTYTISEKTPVPGGVTRDLLVVTYTVTVSDKGDGTLNVTYPTPNDTVFNNTYAATGSFLPSVTKELTGRVLKAGEFSFELKEGATLLQTVSNTAAGAIPFVAINYTLADVGTHTYTISEKTPVPAGVTRDLLVVTYTVTVSDKGDGTLNVSYGTPNDTVFNNTYAATGSFVPNVKKELTGRTLKAGEFSFELKKGATLLQTVSNTAAGAIPFVAINYTLADVGTHIYTITEKTPVPAGVTRDPLVVTYTVTVSDKGDGTLNVVFTPPSDTTFNNTYAAAGSFMPSVTKELTGRVLKAGEFSFELKEGSTLLQTVSNTAGGAIPFTAITYTLADVGTHTYTISEKTPVPAGVTRDPLVVTYIVTVSDKGDGTLTVSYGTPNDTIFNNTYAASGSFLPSVTKQLTGRALKAGEFSFQLKKGDTILQTVTNAAGGAIPFTAINYTLADVGTHVYTISELAPVPAGVTRDAMVVTYTVTVSDKGDGTLNVSFTPPADTEFNNIYRAFGTFLPSVTKELSGRALKAGEFSFELKEGTTLLQTVSNLANGTIPFTAIGYTLADVGVHTYTISEKTPVPGGVTRDSLVVTYTVTVSDKGDGTLNVTYGTPNDTIFNNSYASTGSFLPSVTKELTGRVLKAGEFSFELKEGSTILQTVSNTAAGAIPFVAINYTLANVGTHTYTISEKTPVPAGVTRDPLVVTYVVTVSDKGDGTLNVSYGTPNDTIFNNTYAATGSFTPSVSKALSGRALNSGEVSFELKEGLTVLQTKSNLMGGAIPFTAINYTLEDVGTHTYTITELEPVPSGVTRDAMVVTYVVTVSDKGDGTLNVVYDVPEDTVFNNVYTAEPVDADIEGTKVLEGRDLLTGEFTFELYRSDSEGYVADDALPLVTVTNVGGTWKFTLTYGQGFEGTYFYVVREVAGSLGGVTYDSSEFLFRVDVTDDGLGHMEADVTEPEGGAEFNNIYTAEPVDADIEGTKVLDGRDLMSGEFSFELYKSDSEGFVLEGAVALDTVTNVGGAWKFTLTYEQGYEGTYYYVVREVAGGLGGVTYDMSEFFFYVVVTDNGEGQMEALVYGPEEGAEFVNLYEAEGSFLPVVTKVLEGRELEDGNFTFELTEGMALLQSVQNLADGSIPFLAISYGLEDVGVHTYQIRELASGLPAVLDDPMIVTYVVTVSDNGDGTLDVSYEIPEDTEFNNRINVLSDLEAYYTPEVKKNLIGTDALTPFTFELRALSEGTPMPDGTVGDVAEVTGLGSGIFRFELITFTEEGSYDYEVTEKNTGAAGYAYDSARYLLHIEVELVEELTEDALLRYFVLHVSILDEYEDEQEEMLFTNLYNAEGSFLPEVTKELEGRPLAADEFTFTLTHNGKCCRP